MVSSSVQINGTYRLAPGAKIGVTPARNTVNKIGKQRKLY